MNYNLLKSGFNAVSQEINKFKPLSSIILGSGWSEITDMIKPVAAIPYENIPGLGKSSVEGHKGELILATINGNKTLLFSGRKHYYESMTWEPVIMPAYISLMANINIFIVTNSAGGIRKDLAPGKLMLIDDHINLMHTNPLIGEHHPELGPRFPDMTNVYDIELRNQFKKAAQTTNIDISSGIYCALQGPTYETPAEINMLKNLGADAVGMSTVPEATVAHAAGLKVLGLSCITNYAAGISSHHLQHNEVLMTLSKTKQNIYLILNEFLKNIT